MKGLILTKKLGAYLTYLGIGVVAISLIGPDEHGSNHSVILFICGFLIMFVGAVIHADSREKEAKMRHEANARERIRNIFVKAGNTPDEVEKKTELAEMLLRETSIDWTIFGPTKLSEVVQAVEALRGKK